jgi:hypothetical protein
MNIPGAIATIVAGFNGGGLGALFGARITGRSTVDAASIAAATADAVQLEASLGGAGTPLRVGMIPCAASRAR